MKRQPTSNKKISSRKGWFAPEATIQTKGLGGSGAEFPGQNPLTLLPTPPLLCARGFALSVICCKKGDASWQNQF